MVVLAAKNVLADSSEFEQIFNYDFFDYTYFRSVSRLSRMVFDVCSM